MIIIGTFHSLIQLFNLQALGSIGSLLDSVKIKFKNHYPVES